MTLVIGCLLISLGLFLFLVFLYLLLCATVSWAEYDDTPCVVVFSIIGIIVLAMGILAGLSGLEMVS